MKEQLRKIFFVSLGFVGERTTEDNRIFVMYLNSRKQHLLVVHKRVSIEVRTI